MEVGPFIEGFVAIENLNDARPDRTPTRVAAGPSTAAVGAEANLDPVPMPRGEGHVVFTITADATGVIREMNELNNTVIGSCLILQ